MPNGTDAKIKKIADLAQEDPTMKSMVNELIELDDFLAVGDNSGLNPHKVELACQLTTEICMKAGLGAGSADWLSWNVDRLKSQMADLEDTSQTPTPFIIGFFAVACALCALATLAQNGMLGAGDDARGFSKTCWVCGGLCLLLASGSLVTRFPGLLSYAGPFYLALSYMAYRLRLTAVALVVGVTGGILVLPVLFRFLASHYRRK